MVFVWAAWNWPEEIAIALAVTAPIARSGNSAAFPPLLIAQLKVSAALILAVVWFARRAVTREEIVLPQWLLAFLTGWACVNALATLHGGVWAISLEYLSFSAAGS